MADVLRFHGRPSVPSDRGSWSCCVPLPAASRDRLACSLPGSCASSTGCAVASTRSGAGWRQMAVLGHAAFVGLKRGAAGVVTLLRTAGRLTTTAARAMAAVIHWFARRIAPLVARIVVLGRYVVERRPDRTSDRPWPRRRRQDLRSRGAPSRSPRGAAIGHRRAHRRRCAVRDHRSGDRAGDANGASVHPIRHERHAGGGAPRRQRDRAALSQTTRASDGPSARPRQGSGLPPLTPRLASVRPSGGSGGHSWPERPWRRARARPSQKRRR